MTSLEVIPGRARAARSGASAGQTRLHDTLAVLLLAILFLAPFPLGSNRPFFWAFWALCLGLMLLAFGLVAARRGYPLRVPLASFRTELLLVALPCLYLAVQCLPLGAGILAPVRSAQGLDLPGAAISVARGDTALMLLRWLTYGAYGFLVLQLSRNERRRTLMLQALVAIFAAHAILALLLFHQWGNTLLGFAKWAYLDSVTGTFVNRNSFATFMAFGVTLTSSLLVARLLRPTRQGRGPDLVPVLYLLAGLVMLAAVFGSNSRMGLAVAGLGCLFAVVGGFAKSANARRLLLAIAGVGVLAALALALLYGQDIWLRFLDVGQSAEVRIETYRQVWQMIAARPWLGYGGGAFEQAFGLFHQPPLVGYIWDRAHNTYLTLWVELGVLVGSLPLLALGLVLVRLAAGLVRARESWPAILAALGVLLVSAVHSTVDFSLEMQANALVLVALLAIGLGAVRPPAVAAPA